MKTMLRESGFVFFAGLVVYGMINLGLYPKASTDSASDTIFACGDDRILMLKTYPAFNRADTLWSWRAAETLNLPAEYVPKLKSVDDCKPLGNGDTLLITSSSGATLILERSSKKALFYALTPNAHSIEALPLNRIVVAMSTHEFGNKLALYDRKSANRIIFSDSLYSGHGAVWMPEKQKLYALGFDELRAYALEEWTSQAPKLKLLSKWKLPDEGGHDMSRVSKNELLITTHHNVWRFDLKRGSFTPFAPLNNAADVKSVFHNEKTKTTIYTQAEISWWTHNIYFKNPDGKVGVPQIKLYKIRPAVANVR